MGTTLRHHLSHLVFAGSIVCACCAAQSAVAQQLADVTSSPAALRPDMTFVRETAQDSQGTIGLATIAQQLTSSDIVKSLAEILQQDHIDASDKLRRIVQEKHLSLPLVETQDTAMVRVKLAQLSGSAFDRACLDVLAAAEQDMIQRFEQYARSGGDPELRSYADTMLPKLRKHVAATKDVRASLTP